MSRRNLKKTIEYMLGNSKNLHFIFYILNIILFLFIPLENTQRLAARLYHILRTRGLIFRVSFLTGFICMAFLESCMLPKVALVRKTCVDCHQKEYKKFSSDEGQHIPVTEKLCEGCHIPHGAIGALYLKSQGAALCYSCHEKDKGKIEKKNLHIPVTEKLCEGCHIPHGAIGALYLKSQGAALCYSCHEKDKGKIEKKNL